MLSMNLWNKASEFGSKLKDSLQLSASDKPLVEKEVYDKLNNDYIQLKKDLEEKSKQYDNIMKEINYKKEKEDNLTENESKEYLNKITNKFKNYVLNFFGNNNNNRDEINLIFANPHNENFDSKINEYNRNKFEIILIKNFISNNKEIIEEIFLNKYLSKEEKNNEIDEIKEKTEKEEDELNIEFIKDNKNSINLKDIKSFEDINKIFLKIQNNKKKMESKVEELQIKLDNNIQKFQLFQENIEKFQKDYKEIKNDENYLKEIINQKEKDLSEKENKINELNSLIEKKNSELKEKDININGYIINIEQLNIKLKEQIEIINLFEQTKRKYEEEINNLNSKIKTYKDDLELLQVNSDEINNKNIQITELMQYVESLK